MAYLNANIPVEYAQIRREYLYDLKKHHGEVEDCIIFGVSCITGRALNQKMYPYEDLMNFSFGTLLVIILLLLLGIF